MVRFRNGALPVHGPFLTAPQAAWNESRRRCSAPIAATRMHPLHSQSPATATEGSRQRAASGQSGHRTGEVTLGRSSIGRAVSGLDGPHQDPGPPGGCRYRPARQAEGNKCLDHGCESGMGG